MSFARAPSRRLPYFLTIYLYYIYTATGYRNYIIKNKFTCFSRFPTHRGVFFLVPIVLNSFLYVFIPIYYIGLLNYIILPLPPALRCTQQYSIFIVHHRAMSIIVVSILLLCRIVASLYEIIILLEQRPFRFRRTCSNFFSRPICAAAASSFPPDETYFRY